MQQVEVFDVLNLAYTKPAAHKLKHWYAVGIQRGLDANKLDIGKALFDQMAAGVGDNPGVGVAPAPLKPAPGYGPEELLLFASMICLSEYYLDPMSNPGWLSYRSVPYKTDASVKGHLHYLFAQAMARVVGRRYLDAKYIQDFDYCLSKSKKIQCTGKKKPDLIGYNPSTNRWVLIESKGMENGLGVKPNNPPQTPFCHDVRLFSKTVQETILDKAKIQLNSVKAINNSTQNIDRHICATVCKPDALISSTLISLNSPKKLAAYRRMAHGGAPSLIFASDLARFEFEQMWPFFDGQDPVPLFSGEDETHDDRDDDREERSELMISLPDWIRAHYLVFDRLLEAGIAEERTFGAERTRTLAMRVPTGHGTYWYGVLKDVHRRFMTLTGNDEISMDGFRRLLSENEDEVRVQAEQFARNLHHGRMPASVSDDGTFLLFDPKDKFSRHRRDV